MSHAIVGAIYDKLCPNALETIMIKNAKLKYFVVVSFEHARLKMVQGRDAYQFGHLYKVQERINITKLPILVYLRE